MTFTEAAAEILRTAGKPLHYKEITDLAVEKNLLSHVGKSPEVTMGARLAALMKKEDATNPIVRVRPGVFALREWSGKKAARSTTEAGEVDGSEEINALEVQAAQTKSAASFEDDEDETVVSGEDKLRADLAARGAEFFDDEDDDDQPILGPEDDAPVITTAGGESADAGGGEAGGRRRRRRRRRGRGGREGGEAPAPRSDGLPSFSVSDAEPAEPRDPMAPPPRPQIRERHQIMATGSPTGIDVPEGDVDELAGAELADAAILVFAGFDRNQGPVAIRTLVDALMRRGRLAGDPGVAVSQLGASLRADNVRRTHSGLRPRFRFSGTGRVAPTDWMLSPDLVRLEQDVLAAVERYRDASRRMFLRKLQELPGHVFVELALLALERVGMTQVRSIRRPGTPGGEAHFAAVHRTTEDVRAAIIIRKDGREIGRERVSDLRGAVHHYNSATSGWLITTGQVLSGAKEEASAPGTTPVALYDGLSFAKLLEEHDVAVMKARFPIAIPDLELLETLRGQ